MLNGTIKQLTLYLQLIEKTENGYMKAMKKKRKKSEKKSKNNSKEDIQ